MKKLLSLVMVLCMMLSATALCEVKANAPEGVVVTDLQQRAEAPEAIKARLETASKGIVENVFHNDQILAEIAEQLKNHEMFVSEVFDVDFAADGNPVQLKLQPSVIPQYLLVVDSDGAFAPIEFTVEGADVVVDMAQPGTIIMLCTGDKMGIGQAGASTNAVAPAGPEENDNFMPSISGKPSPEVAGYVGDNGETGAAVIGDTNDDTAAIVVPDANYVIVTSHAEVDSVADALVRDRLTTAYNQILNADNVGALNGVDLGGKDLVVKDLFDVAVYGEYAHYLCDNDNFFLDVALNTDLTEGQEAVVIHSVDGETWHTHAAEEAVVGANGQINLRMFDQGVVALLVPADNAVQADDAVQSPN